MTKYLSVACFCVLLTLHVVLARSGAGYGDLSTKVVNLSRRQTKEIKFCRLVQEERYGGKESTLDVFIGSTVMMKSCKKCTCTEVGWSCRNTYPIVFAAPQGCKPVIDGCVNLFVKQYDETRRCSGTLLSQPERTVVGNSWVIFHHGR